MSTKQDYLNIQTNADIVEQAISTLVESIIPADVNAELSEQISNIDFAIHYIQQWTDAKITALEQEELNHRLTTFLTDLKGIMQTANAKIEIVSGMPPYGELYGGTDVAFKISVENTDGSLSASHVVDQVMLKAEYL